jgi:CMP-N-acetylneuraminic acid synthetase
MLNRNIAIIPARKRSVGLKHKNRVLFKNTADFLDTLEWFDEVIVSTDDQIICNYSLERNYLIHNRPDTLAGSSVPIKAVFESLVNEIPIGPNDFLWLFYLPILYKNKKDFDHSFELIMKGKINSLCSFIPAASHPFNCWKYDDQNKKLIQYIPNYVFRRQDLPPAWMLYHYICCFKAIELPVLNNELINENTYPLFLSKQKTDCLMEIDTPADYEKWLAISKKESSGD